MSYDLHIYETQPKLYAMIDGELKELYFKTYSNLTLEESKNRVYSLLFDIKYPKVIQ